MGNYIEKIVKLEIDGFVQEIEQRLEIKCYLNGQEIHLAEGTYEILSEGGNKQQVKKDISYSESYKALESAIDSYRESCKANRGIAAQSFSQTSSVIIKSIYQSVNQVKFGDIGKIKKDELYQLRSDEDLSTEDIESIEVIERRIANILTNEEVTKMVKDNKSKPETLKEVPVKIAERVIDNPEVSVNEVITGIK